MPPYNSHIKTYRRRGRRFSYIGCHTVPGVPGQALQHLLCVPIALDFSSETVAWLTLVERFCGGGGWAKIQNKRTLKQRLKKKVLISHSQWCSYDSRLGKGCL